MLINTALVRDHNTEPEHDKTNKIASVPSEDYEQSHSLIRVFIYTVSSVGN